MVYRAAVIGCGKIGSEFDAELGRGCAGIQTHAAAYTACKQTHLVAVCDADPSKLERCAEHWRVKGRYRSALQLLEEERPEIVSVCTPDVTHHELICAVLQTEGIRAVLAEKPLALTLGDAQELVALAERRGVVLAVNFSRRYSPSHVSLGDFLRAGGIGPIRLLTGLYTKGTIHNGTHWFDLARFLVGEVVRVAGHDRLHEIGDDPTLDARLEFQSGAIAELHACAAGDFTVFEMDLIGRDGRVRVVESGHVMEFFEVSEGIPFVGYRSLVQKKHLEDRLDQLLLHAVEDVVGCLEQARSPRCSGSDGIAALRIALAVGAAARSGGTVSLDPG